MSRNEKVAEAMQLLKANETDKDFANLTRITSTNALGVSLANIQILAKH